MFLSSILYKFLAWKSCYILSNLFFNTVFLQETSNKTNQFSSQEIFYQRINNSHQHSLSNPTRYSRMIVSVII